MKTCYYELLGVEAHASDLELKKAYRKKALQYHPDKNPDNIDEATAIFAEIRAAYEVLADPQERAWYDSHKDQILSDTPLSQYDDEDDYVVDSAVTGVTTEELLMFFNTSLYTKFDNSPAGFYQIAGRVFAKLAKDEVQWGQKLGLAGFKDLKDIQFEENINNRGYILACDSLKADLGETLFPIFGYSNMSYDELKVFYKKWSSFTTLKSFSWKDEYMYSRNYDRRTKREISKRNEKARTKAKEEYIKTVKRYVTFIKKMDKRMKEGAKKAEQQRKEEERVSKEAAKIAREQKVKNNSNPDFELQSWQTVDQENWEELERQYERDFMRESATQSDLDDIHKDSSYVKIENDDNSTEEIIIYDCFICNKTFKSEKQLENHNNTKLHKKNFAKVQKEMKKESMALGLDELSDYDEFDSAVDEDEKVYHEMELDDIDRELQEIEKQLAEQQELSSSEEEENADDISRPDDVEIEIDDGDSDLEQHSRPSEPAAEPSEDSQSDEEDKEDEISKLLRELEESKNKKSDDSDDDWGKKPKKKKNKAPPKKAQQPNGSSSTINETDTLGSGDIGGTEKCSQCNAAFHSRNKLFEHIKIFGHTAPVSKKNKKNKKRK